MYHRKRVSECYAELEIAALKQAEQIDPEYKYHINGIVETIEQRPGNSNGSLWTIRFPYGGKDLTKLTSESSDVILSVFKALPDLLCGIVKFNKNGLYHRDLKLNNILYHHDNVKVTVRLIDFGIASNSAPGNMDPIYQNVYALWPFETLMISGQQDIFSDHVYGEYINDPYFKRARNIHNIDLSEYKHNIITLRRAYRDTPIELYLAILQGIDVYSMGISLTHLITEQPIINALGQVRQQQLLKLCRCMIEPYTKQRITMSMAAQELQRILDS